MKGIDIVNSSISDLTEAIYKKKVSCVALYEAVCDRIASHENTINAYITVVLDEALRRAQALDKHIAKSSDISLSRSSNPLLGIPFSVKDVFATKGIKTTVASKMLKNYVPPFNATVYDRLVNAGGVTMGKTNMDEFAHGFTTEYSACNTTKNPWDIRMVPGGSSGGSAASVAARMALLSLASENFGSIAQPSALCGVFGMKPTYGISSRYGLIAMASSLECPGIIGRCVEDVAVGISVISGRDVKDATSIESNTRVILNTGVPDISSMQIGVVEEIVARVDTSVQDAIQDMLHTYSSLGATIIKLSWYDLETDGQIYDVLYRAEVASNLARYDGIRYGNRAESDQSLDDYYVSSREAFGPHVKRQILTDPVTLCGEKGDVYTSALRLRRIHREYIDKIFTSVDAVCMPATTFLSLELGKTADKRWRNEHRELGTTTSAMMCPTVLYGYPSITLPIAVVNKRYPVGGMLFAQRFREQTVLSLAYAFQEATGLKFLDPTV